MSRPEKVQKSGFVIKLSNETVQKLTEEQQQAKLQQEGDARNFESIDSEKESKDSIDVSVDSKEDNNITEEVSDNNKQHEINSDLISKKNSDETVKSDKESTNEKEVHSASWSDHAPYVTYEGEEAIYTDPSTHQKYIWSKESNSWVLQESDSRVYSYEDDTHVYTEADGSKFFWDIEKKAWIPKVDDDFLAYYQMSYGFIDNKADEKPKEEIKKKEPKPAEPTPGTLKRKQEAQWFQPDQETNTKVYVSNLPLDLTEEEFVNFMQKCGLVERDPNTQKMKVKLYMDKEHNCFKGDALCTYIKIESVDLALKLLDGGDLKGNKIKVERALFQMKGDYNPALKPKKKKKKELEKLKKMQQKLFDWRPEKFIGERSKHERIVIVKNLFHPTDFDKDVQLILDYQQDLREECSKCGEVRKVVIYDRHPEGVAQITMKEPEMADAVIQLINGRWFGKRQITAEIWDGRTKYRIAETDAEISKRIGKWDQFLEGKDGEENVKADSGTTERSKDSLDTNEEQSAKKAGSGSTERSKDSLDTNEEQSAKKADSGSTERSKDSLDTNEEQSAKKAGSGSTKRSKDILDTNMEKSKVAITEQASSDIEMPEKSE